MNRFLTLLIAALSLLSVSCSAVWADLGIADNESPEYDENGNLVDPACDSSPDCGGLSETRLRELRAEDDDGFERDGSGRNPIRQRVSEAIEASDVIPGMTQAEVVRSWGEPIVREFAGRGSSGRERWVYGLPNSSRGETYLIFEKGRVVGWHR